MKQQQINIGDLLSRVDATRLAMKALGYECQTTFPEDFLIAETIDGEAGIKDTFNRAMKYWIDDKIYGTELVMTLNHKSWQHYDKGNEKLATLYTELYEKAHNYILNHYKGEDLKYYLEVTD